MRVGSHLLQTLCLAFVLLTYSGSTFSDLVDDAYKTGQANARARLRKAQEVGCEDGIKRWAEFVEAFGKYVQEVHVKTKPNSKERLKAVEEIKATIEKIDDDEYLENKRAHQQFMATTDKLDSYELHVRESWITTLLNHKDEARRILFTKALAEPGKSKVTYSRLAEQECTRPY